MCTALLALLPVAVGAAGMGKLTVESYLGQPFKAQIDLVAVEAGDVGSIAARVAPASAYTASGLTRLQILSSFNFSVEKRPNGDPYLKVSSNQSVNEPYLELLIELNWPAGRLLREYTVLLDPPGYVAAVKAPLVVRAPVVEAPVASVLSETPPVAQTAQPEIVTPPRPVESAPTPSPKPLIPAAKPGADSYGPVKRGETLYSIARALNPEGYSLDQMLLALYQNNKQAFAGNMNRLKAGRILQVPDRSQLAALDQTDARKEVRVHARDFNAYRASLSAAVAESAPSAEGDRKQAASGKITPKVDDKAAPAEPSKDVLRLSKGEVVKGAGTGSGDAKQSQALQDRMRALEEDAAAREQSLKEANQRIADLEKNIQDMQRLIELKNQELASLQAQAGAAKPPATPAIPPADEAGTPTETPATEAPEAPVTEAPT
ncbi:MAG: type IV pilus assembly protein FimV, partial [Burkholderiales bacterium]